MTRLSRTGPLEENSVNTYTSKIVKIAIGREKKSFSIHKEKLETLTSFFDAHGEPLSTPTRDNSAPPSEPTSDELFIPISEDGDVPMKIENREQATDKATGKPDYIIVDRFHTVGAFTVFAAWLYKDPPTTPTNKVQCKNLLQAYVLARQYNAYGLQNIILDRFRDHHSEYNLDLDNLIWLANRIEDSTESCALTAYFVEQAAFEITDRGYDDFNANNIFFKTFLTEGQWTIRLELFRALTRHAQESGGRLGDPAKSQREDWHVEIAGENAGQIRIGARRGMPARAQRASGPGS